MTQDAKKRQKSLQRKAAKRKQKLNQLSQLTPLSVRTILRQSGDWPLREVLVSENWTDPKELVQVLIARQSAANQIAVGLFLVDLACLGVKNGYARLVNSFSEYQKLRQEILDRQLLISADLNLAAKIIQTGLAYARQFGFEPHPDYYEALWVLGQADPAACLETIPVRGPEGKPFFIAGPYDNAEKIIARLTKAVGPDGFNYMVAISPDTEFYLDEAEDLN